MELEDRKRVALAFLETARAGQLHLELARFVTPEARHHNAYFPAGMEALSQAMAEAAQQQPDASLEVQRVVAEGDLVMVHSWFRQAEDDRGFAVVHIFRFEGDKVAELWDFGQPVPADMPNADGMF